MILPLAFEDLGSGPPLLLLHGLFGSASNWRRIAKSLSASHRVLSVDLRNHGASPWAATMSYVEMAADVGALIDRLGLVIDGVPPAVLGHSMGGKVAMTLALTDAAKVGPADRRGHRAGLVRRSLLVVHGGHARGRRAERDESRRDQAGAAADDSPRTAPSGFLMTNLVAQGDRYDWRINLAAIGMAMSGIGAFPEQLANLRYDGPVTVIDGERSDYVSTEDRPRFEALFPRVRFVTVADAGHWLHADRPEAFVDAVRDAL